MKNKIEVYTDGGCKGNGRIDSYGASAFLIKQGDNILHQESRGYRGVTNQVAEVDAIIHAMRHVIEQRYKAITIYTDSEYSMNVIKGVYSKRGFLWDIFDKVISSKDYKIQVGIEHVKSHTGNTYNEIVDDMCTEVMNKVKQKNIKHKNEKIEIGLTETPKSFVPVYIKINEQETWAEM